MLTTSVTAVLEGAAGHARRGRRVHEQPDALKRVLIGLLLVMLLAARCCWYARTARTTTGRTGAGGAGRGWWTPSSPS
jgi:hypothetical protein